MNHAYYNELDANKAAWLRELVKAGAIAPGDVDERSIDDVKPDELIRYTQCHFFAGIGIWSYALRLSGWPDDQPVWTGSCPCQPFSAAGKKAGFADRRHLWPAWFKLIAERRPVVCFGEQVSSPDGLTWIDLVCTDMEGAAYTIGTADLCAAGVGAPHIRNRTFFVADTGGERIRASGSGSVNAAPGEMQRGEFERKRVRPDPGEYRAVGGVAESDNERYERDGRARDGRPGSADDGSAILMADTNEAGSQGRGERGNGTDERAAGPGGVAGGMGNANCAGLKTRDGESIGREPRPEEPAPASSTSRLAHTDGRQSSDGGIQRSGQHGQQPQDRSAGPVNGYWADAQWIWCRPEKPGDPPKLRPTQPAPFGMADELAVDLGRVCLPDGKEAFFPLIQKGKRRTQRLRGYGDGIVAEVAAEFVRSYIDVRKI